MHMLAASRLNGIVLGVALSFSGDVRLSTCMHSPGDRFWR